MSETRQLVVDTTRRIFQDLGDPQTVNAAQDEAWKAPLWQALEEAGLTLAMVSEDLGGAGLSASDSLAILRTAGAFAVALPLAETILASACLSRAGLVSPTGPMTLAPARAKDRITLAADGTLSGSARLVAFAADCDHLAVFAYCDEDGNGEGAICLVAAADCRIKPRPNIAGEGRDEVSFDGVKALETARAPDRFDADALIILGAIARSMQMAGALEALLDISVEYAQERVAFERPIAKFQAVQHNLARLAEEAAAAVAIANSAAYALEADASAEFLFLEAAAAKIRCGEAAGEVAAIAHQVHGAIGFTDEHILHRYSHRLYGWRDDFGNESQWAARLGEAFCAQGGDMLWSTLTAA